MIQIDGINSGGQVLRYALALSALTGRPFTITNIRANKSKPGILPQHLAAIKFLKEITDAYVEGEEVGSERLLFYPRAKNLRSNYVVDIGTAGSITLFLQAVLPFLVMQDRKITLEVIGGTDVLGAIPYDYFKWIFLFSIQNIAQIDCNLLQRGYYPKGKGKLELFIRPKQKQPLIFLERGDLEYVRGMVHASSSLARDNIAERCADAAQFILKSKATTSVDVRYSPSESDGAGILLYVQYANYRVGSDLLLDGRVPEVLGREVAEKLLACMDSFGVDSHLLDNLIIYLGLVGGKVEFDTLTAHAEHAILVVEEFLNVVFKKVGNSLIVEPSESQF